MESYLLIRCKFKNGLCQKYLSSIIGNKLICCGKELRNLDVENGGFQGRFVELTTAEKFGCW